MGGTLSTEPAKDSTKKKKSKKKGDDKDLIVPSERQTADEPQPEAAEWPEAATTVEAEPEGSEEWPEGMPARGEPWPVERPASRKPSVPDAASPATWRTPATPLRGRSEVEPETDSFGVFGMLPKSSRTYSRQLAERTQGTTQSTSALPASCLLRIRVLKAQLRKKRAGLVGDLAEVAVVARLGRQAARTALAELGAQGAEWHETLELRVPETPGAGRLDLEVMSMTVHREELLGKTSLQLASSGLGPAWTRRRMPLGAGECQLDLEMQLLPPGVQPQGEREQEDLDYQLGARMFQPKGQALPWLGVRVLELTRRTWTAPFAGRLMASCGAEVVRCAFGEEALLVRKKQGVKVGAASKEPHSVPKELHHGKRLAKELPEDPRDLATLKAELLPGCNVFLTDLPADELDEMQLGAVELRQQYPWLIFVHASTVGMLADVSNKGISDAGAFFSLSGLAEQLGHVLGPAGFAAAVAGSALFGVASMAVMRRRCGSPGDRVEMSIFRAGRWCSGLGALTGWTRPPAPDLRLAAEGVAVPPMATPFDVEGVGFVPPKRPAGANPRWSVLEPSLLLPAVRPECPVAAELPLARVSVIELSDEYQVKEPARRSWLRVGGGGMGVCRVAGR
ncbi:unnamed protein product [Effrenium voratum]|nr:unnamed protein product [Effrenium voratum]